PGKHTWDAACGGDRMRRLRHASVGAFVDRRRTFDEPAARMGPTVAAMWAAYQRQRFAWLFASLLVTLAAGATLEALVSRYNVLRLWLGLNPLAATAALGRERRLPLWLGGIFILSRGVLATLGVPGMLAVSDMAWVTAIVLTTIASMRHAFGRGIVDRERVFA